MELIRRAERKWYLSRKRRKLKNKTASILSSNCNGAMILHDMGCRFDTPTVNLYFLPEDFLTFLSDLPKYLSAVPQPITGTDKPFPVGQIEDITVYFMHYSSFEEARDKWVERSARVDMDNLFIMMTDQNGCTEEQIARFDALPYQNKVIFTHKPYPMYKSAYYIRGFEDQEEVGVLSDNRPGFWKRRFLDAFDYVRFLNGKGLG